MTVETTTNRAQYATNGTTGPWTVPFYFLDNTHLQVIYTDSSGNETTLTLTTHYTVTGAGVTSGGAVTTVTAYTAGGYITILRNVPALQQVDYVENEKFPAPTHERALDLLTMLLQQLQEITGRSLVFAPSDTAGSSLPAVAARANKYLSFDSLGRVTTVAPSSGSAADLAANLLNTASAPLGDAMIGEKRTATGAVATTRHDSNEKRAFDVARDFGVTAASSPAAVKAALQLAISAAGGLTNGGVVIVPPYLKYGYIVSDKTTWPSFAGITVPVLVLDYSAGSSYAGYPTAYDGSQVRSWFFTPQTTSPGQHDGNTHWIRGAWAPNLCISNDQDLTGARAATDNRRANITYFTNGLATWRLGQGSLDSSTATDEELCNFALEKFSRTGDTLGAYTPFVIERKTGNWSFGGATNAPPASYHFKSIVIGFVQGMFEALTTTSAISLRNSNGAGDDVQLKNVAGDIVLNIPALGDALVIKKATRNVLIGAGSDDPAAIVNIASTTKGLLLPRMTTAQRDAISSPPAGLLIYNTTTGKLNFRAAAAWEAVTSA